MEQKTTYLKTPIGVLEIIGTTKAIQSILFVEEEGEADDTLPEGMERCLSELKAYFDGTNRHFTFPYEQQGTPFQHEVWTALATVPFGSTVSYRQVAEQIQRPLAVRAVGRSNGLNRLSIVVPCHRIIGSNGTLTGYAGGLWRKEWLLRHEAEIARSPYKKTVYLS